MADRPYQTIVFDLGNVLIGWDPRNLYRKIMDKEEEMEYFLSNICTMDWNAEQDRGRSWDLACRDLAEKYPDYHALIWAYWHRWPETLSGPIEENVALLETFKKEGKYRLYGLTNWSAEAFPYARKNFPFLQHFRDILVSGEEGLIKPDPAIYHLLYQRFDINPATAVFIDDSLKNVIAARKRAWTPSISTIRHNSKSNWNNAVLFLKLRG